MKKAFFLAGIILIIYTNCKKDTNTDGTSPVAEFIISPASVTKLQSVQFTDKSTNFPTSWLWTFGDGTTSTAQNPSKTYNAAGTYPVSLIATNNFGYNTRTQNFIVTEPSNTGNTNIEFVTVEGGSFKMGSITGESDERPVHQVTLNRFKISKTEVTNAQFIKFLNSINCNSSGIFPDSKYGNVTYINMKSTAIGHNGTNFYFKGNNYAVLIDCPVIYVTWYGANAFCLWLGGQLPTEAQWEFAARGGSNSKGYTFSGSNAIDEVSWNWFNSGGTTHPVGLKLPNELGLYDMSGNVWEWCFDWYDSHYYTNSPDSNPDGPKMGSARVARGGSLGPDADGSIVTRRGGGSPTNSDYNYGFRVTSSL